MNSSYFSRVFKGTVGVSFIEYLIRLRISNAESLIKTTQLSIIDIAEECGLSSVSNFYSAYKKLMGHNPSYVRKL